MKFTREEKELILKTCCPNDIIQEHYDQFIHICEKSGLDPLRKQAYCQYRWNKKNQCNDLVFIAGVDGMQDRAHSFPDYRGTVAFEVCENDDFTMDAIAGEPKTHLFHGGNRGKVLGAWSRVRRENMDPFTVYVSMDELGGSGRMWDQMPGVMIAKVARSTALRRAYPDAFSAVYSPEEMGEDAKEEAESDESKPDTSQPKVSERTTSHPTQRNNGHGGSEHRAKCKESLQLITKQACSTKEERQDLGQYLCRILSEFTGKDGFLVAGKSKLDDLSEGRLKVLAKKLSDQKVFGPVVQQWVDEKLSVSESAQESFDEIPF